MYLLGEAVSHSLGERGEAENEEKFVGHRKNTQYFGLRLQYGINDKIKRHDD